jgi:hypothetical protein
LETHLLVENNLEKLQICFLEEVEEKESLSYGVVPLILWEFMPWWKRILRSSRYVSKRRWRRKRRPLLTCTGSFDH